MQRNLLIGFVIVCMVFSGFIIFRYIINLNQDVIVAFEKMNNRLEGSNFSTQYKIDSLKSQIISLKDEAIQKKALKIDSLSANLNAYIQNLKDEILDSLPYKKESDGNKGNFLIEQNAKKGKLLVTSIEDYRTNILNILDSEFPEINSKILNKFETTISEDDSDDESWLDYHFKGFPTVAILTKLTQIQADIQTVQCKIYSAYLK